MPIIPICDSSGLLVAEAPVVLFARMLFPDKPDSRRHMVFGAVIEVCMANGMSFGPQVMELARTLPTRSDLKALADQRFAVGLAVGYTFNIILSLSASGIASRASFNTVSTIVAKRLENKGVLSQRTLQEWWDLMAPVRHFWAAWIARGRQINHFEYIEGEEGPTSHTAAADLACFLLEAEQALAMGANHRSSASRHTTKGLAGTDFSLALPGNWQRPRPFGPFGTYRVAPADPSWLEEISRLRAEASSQPHKPRKSGKKVGSG